MTREERAMEVLRDQFGDDLAKWVVRYGDPPAAVGTHHAIAAMLAFADAEAAAMRERAADYLEEYSGGHHMAKSCASVIRFFPIRVE